MLSETQLSPTKMKVFRFYRECFDGLTPRERDTITVLAETGLANKDIGLELGISENTARTYLRKAREKFLTNSKTTVMIIVLACGFIGLGEVAKRLAKKQIMRTTPRELQVLKLLVLMSGGTNEDVGMKLGISENTARTHRKRVMEKLSSHNREELILTAIVHELVSLEDVQNHLVQNFVFQDYEE